VWLSDHSHTVAVFLSLDLIISTEMACDNLWQRWDVCSLCNNTKMEEIDNVDEIWT